MNYKRLGKKKITFNNICLFLLRISTKIIDKKNTVDLLTYNF